MKREDVSESSASCFYIISYGSLAQLGEHLPYKQGVVGSSPTVPTKAFCVSKIAYHLKASRSEAFFVEGGIINILEASRSEAFILLRKILIGREHESEHLA